MAVLKQVTRKVPVKTLRPLQMQGIGGGGTQTKRAPGIRRLDPLKSKHAKRTAQGNNSVSSAPIR